MHLCLSYRKYVREECVGPLEITDHTVVPHVRRDVLNFFVCVTRFIIY